MATSSKYRLLLLDPDREYMAKLAAVLEPDYEICALDHPHAALEILDRYMPDIIMLEVDLPDMDGIKFAHKIRRCPAHKGVPLVFVTQRDTMADRHLGFMVQAAMYLSKQLRPQRIALDLGIFIRESKPNIRPKTMDHGSILNELAPLPQLPGPAPLTPPPSEPVQEEKMVVEKIGTAKIGIDAFRRNPAPLRLSVPGSVAEISKNPSSDLNKGIKPPRLGPVGERIRVLIADGEYATVFSIESLLNELFNCIAATSGPEALDKAQRFMPDLLILGMGLPQIPGYEICQKLRALPPFEKTPILGVTRGGDLPRIECEKIYGVTQVFHIPAEFDRLGRRVREIIKEPGFRRHTYPQTFTEVWAEEEHYRMLRG